MSSDLNPLHRHSNAAVVTSNTKKREFDDSYAVSGDTDSDFSSDDYSVTRMRKEEFASSSFSSLRHHTTHATSQSADDLTHYPSRLQLLIRSLPVSNTIVIQVNDSDSIAAVHEKINSVTRVPVDVQRLIYEGRQLYHEQSLRECRVKSGANLQLVARLRSTKHPQICILVNDMVSHIFHLCRGGQPRSDSDTIKSLLSNFIFSTSAEDRELSGGQLQIFLSASVPAALVMLYMSPIQDNKKQADDSIEHFAQICRTTLDKSLHKQYSVIMFEFCKLLRCAVGIENLLYCLCRGCLGLLAESAQIGAEGSVSVGSLAFLDVFPFLRELADELSQGLVSFVESGTPPKRFSSNVDDFVAFSSIIRKDISVQLGRLFLTTVKLCKDDNRSINDALHYKYEIESFHCILVDLLKKMNACLKIIEDHMNGGSDKHLFLDWWQFRNYLTILKELNNISKLYTGAEETFWLHMKQKESAISFLIVRCARRTEDHEWILEHKEVTNFEARTHLALMLLPEMNDDYEELHEMLIDRTNLLVESFEYIAHAKSSSLHGELLIEFKNEEATGPGVLREWFSLVFQAIFNPQNALFVACPNDLRRFLPNP